MLINGEEYHVNDLLNNLDLSRDMKCPVNELLDLTRYQIEILTRYQIDYQSATSLKDLLYKIEEVLEETDAEELELIASEIQDRDYYENTNK